jgi:ABC-type polar amino acid transport system ATPase subunit
MERLARDGMTMVVVSHEMHFVRDVASRVIFMDGGLFIEDAPPSVIFTNPQDERTRQFLTHIL